MSAISAEGVSPIERSALRHLAATRGHDALIGATAILFMIAEDMERVGERGAEGRLIHWETALKFIARSLDDNAGEIWQTIETRKKVTTQERYA